MAGEGAAGGFDRGIAAEMDGERAAAVAAGGDFAAIRIPEAGADGGGVAGFDEDELVETDAGTAVGEVADLIFCQGDRGLAGIEQQEIIAEAVHLEEAGHG